MVDITFGKKIDGVTYLTRTGAYLIAFDNNLLACIRTSGRYFLIGGGIEEPETHTECILRECLEETGYAADVQTYIGCAEEARFYPGYGYFHLIQFYYSGRLLKKQLEPVEPDHGLAWIAPDEIDEKLYIEAQRWAVKTYLQQKAERSG